MDSTSVTDHQTCFQLKANFSPCTIMQLMRNDLTALVAQLTATIQSAPNFFLNSPVVIDLEMIKTTGLLDFVRLKQILLMNQMVPIGVRGGTEEQLAAAMKTGIPTIAISGKSTTPINKAQPISSGYQATKLITSPVRSGMQIYAKDADLIVTAAVSPGAELMADGHIHIYGPLRGRALAGVQGNTQARIFCRNLAAELVSIAGYYLMKDDMQNLPTYNSSSLIQIFLEDNDVKIATL
jgi:septum site-determining protein MinC